jgi:hypothetical protein
LALGSTTDFDQEMTGVGIGDKVEVGVKVRVGVGVMVIVRVIVAVGEDVATSMGICGVSDRCSNIRYAIAINRIEAKSRTKISFLDGTERLSTLLPNKLDCVISATGVPHLGHTLQDS